MTSLRDTVRALPGARAVVPMLARRLASGAAVGRRAAVLPRVAVAGTLIVGLASASESAVGAPAPVTTEAAPAAKPTPTPQPAGTSGPPASTPPGSPAATTPDAPPATTPPADATEPGTTATTDPGAPDDDLVPRAPTRKVSYAAQLIVPTAVRKRPSTRAKKITTLKPYGSWNGGPVVLSIAQVKVINGKRWLRVRLPIRPNNTTGWVSESSVAVSRLRYRIEVRRRARTLTLLRDGKRIASTRVVIGAPSTPTPRGTFAVLEVVRQPRGSILGPWALHLTAHSNVLDNFGGGPGRVALHGRSGSLLNDPLGSSRSHGCVRMPNAVIAKLADVAVEGTPVTIR